MNADRSSQFSQLMDAVREQWDSSACPDIREQIDSASIELEPQEVLDLLLLDQAYRWQSGQSKSAEEYLCDFPEVKTNPDFQLDLVYGEYRAQKKRGASEPVAGFVERFPHLADRFKQQIDMGKLFESGSEYDTTPGDAAVGRDTTQALPAQGPTDVDHAPLSADDFHLIRQLGSGAMGEVHLAVQKSLNKRVALKSLTRFPSNRTDLVERFIREARAVASLQHPNIVGVHGIGRFAEGGYFLVMDLVEGKSLQDAIQHQPLAVDQAIHVVGQVARAVDHAHRKGVVHRDLKPANIMLDGAGNAMVTDFGLAKSFFVPGPEISQEGQVVGTPSFMSPEQARGDISRIDARSDVYAVGAILYACLSGEAPYKGASTAEVLAKVVSEDPPPLDALRGDTPTELAAVCEKCLQKDPTRRFATAEAVANALDGIRSDDPKTLATARHRRSTRRRLMGLGVAIVACVLCAAAVSSLRLFLQPMDRIVDVDWRIDVYRGDKTSAPIKLVETPGPLLDNDSIKVRLTLSQPAYPYVFWVDSQGNVQPLYPLSPASRRVDSLVLPDTDMGYPITGAAGTEVLVLVVRHRPVGDVEALAEQIRPRAAFGELARHTPLIDGQPIQGTGGESLDANEMLAQREPRPRSLGDPQKLPPSQHGAHSLQRWRDGLPADIGQTHFLALSHVKNLSQSVLPAPASIPVATTSDPARLALLVGVQEYQSLGRTAQLSGSRNDVAVMKAVLNERFGFDNNNILTLVDREATSGAIRAQLRHLVDRVHALPPAQAPAEVVFHFSGHGSQVPDQDTEDADEPIDGLDETLVPYDAVRQGGPADIRDDELYDFAERICAEGRARLWIVLDCCHSGSGARGITKIRQLHRPGVMAQRPVSRGTTTRETRRLPEGAVALYACRAVEVEPEYEERESYLYRIIV